MEQVIFDEIGDLVEMVARAIAKASGINDWFKAADEYRDEAVAAIKIIRQQSSVKVDDGGLTIADYEEVLADHRRLVRELDVALNGEEGAAKQASLCDIVSQVKALRSSEMPNGSGKED